MNKRFVCILAIAMMLFAVVPIVNDEVVADSGGFAGGSGTLDDPFLISTENQLRSMVVTAGMEYYYLQTCDIEVTKPWTPIGTEEDPFIGFYNGAGFVISGIEVSGDLMYAGLFGNSEGLIISVFLEDASVSSSAYVSYAGLIAGRNAGQIDNSYARDSTISIDSESEDVVMYSCVGGIAGSNAGIISCCDTTNVGIDVAQLSYDSISTGYHTPHYGVQNRAYAGGICGYSIGTITDCLSDAVVNVFTHSYFTGSTMGGFEPMMTSYAGGLVGYQYGELKNSAYMNAGKVTSTQKTTGSNLLGTPSSHEFCTNKYDDICCVKDADGCVSVASDVGRIPITVYQNWNYVEDIDDLNGMWYIVNGEPELSHLYLRIDALPAKTVYKANEPFSDEGLQVGLYNTVGGWMRTDYSSATGRLSDDWTMMEVVVCSDIAAICYAEFEVEVHPEWAILSYPSKTEYYVGEVFDTSNLKIGYRMYDTEEYRVYTDYTYLPSVIEEGTTAITVKAGDWEVEIPITVTAPPEDSIRMEFVDDRNGNFSEFCTPGEEIVLRAVSSDGATFKGWNTESDGSGTMYQPGDSYTMGDKSAKLYAIWETEDTGGWCSFILAPAIAALIIAFVVPIALVRW